MFISTAGQRMLSSARSSSTPTGGSVSTTIQMMAAVVAISGLAAIGTANAAGGGAAGARGTSTNGLSGAGSVVDSTDTAESNGVTAGEGSGNSSYGAPGSTGRSTNPFQAAPPTMSSPATH